MEMNTKLEINTTASSHEVQKGGKHKQHKQHKEYSKVSWINQNGSTYKRTTAESCKLIKLKNFVKHIVGSRRKQKQQKA